MAPTKVTRYDQRFYEWQEYAMEKMIKERDLPSRENLKRITVIGCARFKVATEPALVIRQYSKYFLSGNKSASPGRGYAGWANSKSMCLSRSAQFSTFLHELGHVIMNRLDGNASESHGGRWAHVYFKLLETYMGVPFNVLALSARSWKLEVREGL